MIEKNKIEERRKEFAEELHAGSVFRDIQAREKERKEFEKRWFWELLQNAKDSVPESEKVNIKIEIKEKEIAFSHSGNPFELDEILSLIIQGSSKTDDDSKTGRFGTGFMTTYLLSKKVKITGQLTNDNGYFDFWLNRDGQDVKDFYRLQTTSNDDFIKSIQENSYTNNSEFKTRFVYNLDEKGEVTSKKGLQSLNELIPFTQLFNKQIGSITVDDTGKLTTYEKEKIKEYELFSYKIEEWKLKSSNTKNTVKAYIIRDNEFDVVLVTEVEGEIEKLIKIDNKYPRLFFTFPLIGTEELGIPFIINSTSFDPKIERDGIYLNSNGDSSNGITRNKRIISKSLEVAISIFPEIIKQNSIKDVFNIFDFSISKEYNWIDNIWFNSVKNQQVSRLNEIECILYGEKFKKLSELHIPFSRNQGLINDLWKLLDDLNSFNAIPNLEIENWVSIAQNYAKLKEVDVFEIENIVGSKHLIRYVSNKSSIDVLKEDIIIDKYDWLNNLYSLISSDLEEFPLNKKLLLNQEGFFIEAEKLRWDLIKDNELISISKKLGLNFNQKLISNSVKIFEITGVDSYKKEYAIEDLKNKINLLNDDDYLFDDKIKANALFIKWLIRNNKKDVIKDLKIISLEKSSESPNVVSQVFPNSKHLLLTPKIFFKNNYPLYSEIIREKDCMHPVYNEILDSTDFEWLEKFGFVHYSPLVKRREKLDPKTIEYLIQNPNDLTFIKDGEGKIIFDIEMEFSDFAYLTSSENHIYDRNSTTSSSLKIFNFLLNEATQKDTFFNDSKESIIINEDKTILFDRLLWLKRSKSIQWVNVKNIEDDNANKFSKEVPSSKNLSELIKNNSELINTIRGEKQISFLSRINVGVSDLIRNTLASDEIRISWDKALTNMITSNVDPELVQEIFNDPGIQSEYKKRLNERKLINRNQKIGALIEQLFTELINKLKEKGVKINIKREPFGSDYLLTDETSDLVNDDRKEEVFNINNWLIELKATGKEFAAMTSLQAKTATEKKDEYALIVVPLDGSEPDIEYVRINAKVVGKIGYKLSHLINDFNDIESKKSQLRNVQDGVSVDIEDQNVRFRVNSSVWNSIDGISISEFINKYFDE
jgi:hypothetical protein